MHSAGASRYSACTRKQRTALVTAGDRGDNPVQLEQPVSASPEMPEINSQPFGVGFFFACAWRSTNLEEKDGMPICTMNWKLDFHSNDNRFKNRRSWS